MGKKEVSYENEILSISKADFMKMIAKTMDEVLVEESPDDDMSDHIARMVMVRILAGFGSALTYNLYDGD